MLRADGVSVSLPLEDLVKFVKEETCVLCVGGNGPGELFLYMGSY